MMSSGTVMSLPEIWSIGTWFPVVHEGSFGASDVQSQVPHVPRWTEACNWSRSTSGCYPCGVGCTERMMADQPRTLPCDDAKHFMYRARAALRSIQLLDGLNLTNRSSTHATGGVLTQPNVSPRLARSLLPPPTECTARKPEVPSRVSSLK